MQRENRIGTPFYELSEVDSSNNYAMRQVQAHLAVHGSTWFTHYQNAGKGQRGKVWNAEPGQNIMMSSVIKPRVVSIDEQFVINASVALACYDFLTKYTVDKVSIKWPNDLYWKDRKAGGILIENVLSGESLKFSVVGIGININQTLFPEGLKNPVSLKQITGKTFDVIGLAKELCDHLEIRWQQILQTSQVEIINEYCAYLYRKNEAATFKALNEIFTAVIKGVNRRGELLLENDEGVRSYATIEWLTS